MEVYHHHHHHSGNSAASFQGLHHLHCPVKLVSTSARESTIMATAHGSSKFFQECLQSKGVRWISFGWAGFITENVVLSENRTEIIAAFGDDNYHRLYNSLSTAATLSIAWGFFKHGRGQGPIIGNRGKMSLLTGYILQSIGFIGVSQMLPKFQLPFAQESISATPSTSTPSEAAPVSSSYALRCPMDFKPKDVPADGIYGVDRISRHANFWSIGFVTLGYAATSVFIPEIVMCVWPVIFAYIGTSHQDERYRRGMGGTLSKEKDEKTSNIPFAALLSGRQQWTPLMKEMKWENAGLALCLTSITALRRIRR